MSLAGWGRRRPRVRPGEINITLRAGIDTALIVAHPTVDDGLIQALAAYAGPGTLKRRAGARTVRFEVPAWAINYWTAPARRGELRR